MTISIRKITTILIMTVLFFLSGCTVSREIRIQKVLSQHPEWDQATVEKVANGRVEVGMTEEMILAIMGQPAFIDREGPRQVWTYMTTETSSWGVLQSVPAFFVYLEAGRVVEIKGSQKRVLTPLLYSRSFVP